MTVAALVISIVSLLAGLLGLLIAVRAARASERQAVAGERPARTAARALGLSRHAEKPGPVAARREGRGGMLAIERKRLESEQLRTDGADPAPAG